jgi:hypothetical protein
VTIAETYVPDPVTWLSAKRSQVLITYAACIHAVELQGSTSWPNRSADRRSMRWRLRFRSQHGVECNNNKVRRAQGLLQMPFSRAFTPTFPPFKHIHTPLGTKCARLTRIAFHSAEQNCWVVLPRQLHEWYCSVREPGSVGLFYRHRDLAFWFGWWVYSV